MTREQQRVLARARALDKRRREAQAELDAVQVETVELVIAAREAGVTMVALAHELGVTKQALFATLRRRASRDDG